MSISKTLIVSINKDKAKAQEKMYIYKNDVGVDIYVELSNLGYKFDGVKNNFRYANALFKTPSEAVHIVNQLPIVNKRIKFSFTQDIVDLIQEIGNYELQFQLFDVNQNRLTIPSYYFEVKEPLGNTTLEFDLALADYAKADYSYISEEEEMLFAIDDGYVRTNWNVGDLITSNRLNNMENGISLALEQKNEDIYVSNKPSTVEIGGIPIGYVSDGISLTELIDAMLHPYKAPNVSVSMSPSTTLYELGSVIKTLTLNVKTTQGSENISDVTLLRDGNNLKTSSIANFSQTVEDIKANSTFNAYARDEKKITYSNTLYINFVDPIYIGALSNVTTSEIKKMTKIIANPSSQSYTYNITNQKMCIAFPSNWKLKSIFDVNGFDITSSFSSQLFNMICLDGKSKSYTVYCSNITSQKNFTVKFNF